MRIFRTLIVMVFMAVFLMKAVYHRGIIKIRKSALISCHVIYQALDEWSVIGHFVEHYSEANIVIGRKDRSAGVGSVIGLVRCDSLPGLLGVFCNWWTVCRLFYGRSSDIGGGFFPWRLVDIHDSGIEIPLSMYRVVCGGPPSLLYSV